MATLAGCFNSAYLGLSVASVYLNGEFLDAEAASVSVCDRGYLFGDGVYEVIPVYARQCFALTRHLDRLQRSLQGIRLHNPYTQTHWQEILQALVQQQSEDNQAIYLQVTRGVAPRDHVFPDNVEPAVFVMSNPLKPVPASWHQQGVEAIMTDDSRWQNCHIKAIALLPNTLLRQQAEDAGAQEALLIRDGLLTEGSASNIFIVRDGTILTPLADNRILNGITRVLVIELADALGMPVEVRDISQQEVLEADEIWFTSSTKEIVPVTQLDDKPVGDGQPGVMWQQIYQRFQKFKAEAQHV